MCIQTNDLLQDYHTRIDHIQQYIYQHMDQPLSCEELAAIAGFSLSHFHRIFKAFVGESLATYVRRVRLENAINQIVYKDNSVTDIALSNGYETPSSFTKAFKKQFGITPSELRNTDLSSAAQFIAQVKTTSCLKLRSKQMKAEIRILPDRHVAYIRDEDTFEGISRAWKKLSHFMYNGSDIISDDQECLGILQDVPAMKDISRNDMRYDACVVIREAAYASDKVAAFAEVAVQTLAGGRYAVFLHQGEHKNLEQTWGAAYKDWLPTSGEQLRNVPPFEVYLDSTEKVSAERKTEIYIPIQ